MNIFAFHAPIPDLLEGTASGYKLRVRLPRGLELGGAWLRTEPDNEEILTPMTRVSENERWQLWEGVPKLNTAEATTLYCFKFLTQGRQFWLDGVGLHPYFPERSHHFRLVPSYEPATWVKAQVFYQIFPERFYDGDPSNNVRNGEYLYEGKPVVARSWGELPQGGQGAREFFGGDLEGIRQKLDYLQDLGVTALYLNPVFTSPSSHKYDTVDFCSVDPHFGGNEALARLCEALRERGMRLVLDAVINHTSERHLWFDRYGEFGTQGAYRAKDAPTRRYYTFADEDDPESYHGWYGVKTLPVLDYSNPALRRAIYEADDAVLRRWLRPPYAIDGWRFDVIHMLGEGAGARNNAEYVRHFRRTLREENPQAYVMGEHFFEATSWLQGDQEDGAMNYYGFTLPMRAFLTGLDFRRHPISVDAEDLGYLLDRARAKLPFEIQLSQYNLLDSHDSPRFLTLLGGDAALIRLAVVALFSYVGVPSIYYGDEIGVEGGEDPDCRRPFPWDEASWNHDLRGLYKRLARLRLERKVLQEGAYLQLHAEADVFAFARVLSDDVVITVLNRGEARALELPVWKVGWGDEHLVSLLDERSVRARKGTLRLELAAKSVYLLGSDARARRSSPRA
jgi:alpha-glucosidase